MNIKDMELAEKSGLLGPSSRIGESHEAAARFATMIRADERHEIYDQIFDLIKKVHGQPRTPHTKLMSGISDVMFKAVTEILFPRNKK